MAVLLEGRNNLLFWNFFAAVNAVEVDKTGPNFFKINHIQFEELAQYGILFHLLWGELVFGFLKTCVSIPSD